MQCSFIARCTLSTASLLPAELALPVVPAHALTEPTMPTPAEAVLAPAQAFADAGQLEAAIAAATAALASDRLTPEAQMALLELRCDCHQTRLELGAALADADAMAALAQRHEVHTRRRTRRRTRPHIYRRWQRCLRRPSTSGSAGLPKPPQRGRRR